jgi:hypothetical protein
MAEGARLKGLRRRLVVKLLRVGPIAHIVPLTVAARHGGKDSGGETPAPNTTIVQSITMGLGFITIAAAEAAEAGEGIEEVVVEVVEVRQVIRGKIGNEFKDENLHWNFGCRNCSN